MDTTPTHRIPPRWIEWYVHPHGWTWVRECEHEGGRCLLAYWRQENKPLHGLEPRKSMPGLLESWENLMASDHVDHERFKLLPWQEGLLNWKGRIRFATPRELSIAARKALIRDHEEMRGRVWCEMKGLEFVGIQEWPDHPSLVLYNVRSGSTKSVTWEQVTEDEKDF